MRFLLAVLIGMPVAHAGWWSSFCQRYLVAEDPYPYAEVDFAELIEFYLRTHKGQILDEILYRLRAGMLTPAQQNLFWTTFRPDQK